MNRLFTVHMTGEPAKGFDVWLERHWSQGPDAERHDAAEFGGDPSEQSKAEIYALTLAETHGDCAVVMH